MYLCRCHSLEEQQLKKKKKEKVSGFTASNLHSDFYSSDSVPWGDCGRFSRMGLLRLYIYPDVSVWVFVFLRGRAEGRERQREGERSVEFFPSSHISTCHPAFVNQGQ